MVWVVYWNGFQTKIKTSQYVCDVQEFAAMFGCWDIGRGSNAALDQLMLFGELNVGLDVSLSNLAFE